MNYVQSGVSSFEIASGYFLQDDKKEIINNIRKIRLFIKSKVRGKGEPEACCLMPEAVSVKQVNYFLYCAFN